ncbi:MAG TPA: homoserine kinase [Armatimonadetes bacterium]|nr:homoserine kinase [Armatimonadota bacterium]
MNAVHGVRVRVPATIGNVGSGFDALGLALTWYNTVEVERTNDVEPLVTIEVSGEGCDELPRDATNVCYRAFMRACEIANCPPPPICMRLHNTIPLARGLGSSATARIGGILAANALLGNALTQAQILSLASQLEGHPDNVAPALLGGLVISGWCTDEYDEGQGDVFALRINVTAPLHVIVMVPFRPIATADARRVLPARVSLRDAVFNVSRACLVVGALAVGEFHHLREAVRDKLHQQYRQQLMPWLSAVMECAMECGALGACLSGAGSSVVAFTDDESKAESIAQAMIGALREHGEDGFTRTVHVDNDGAHMEWW